MRDFVTAVLVSMSKSGPGRIWGLSDRSDPRGYGPEQVTGKYRLSDHLDMSRCLGEPLTSRAMQSCRACRQKFYI